MVQKTEMRYFDHGGGDHEVDEYSKKVSCGKVNILLFSSIFLALFGIGYLFIVQQEALKDARTEMRDLSLKMTDLLKNETDQQNHLRGTEGSLNAQIEKIREKLGASNNDTKRLLNDVLKKQEKMKAQSEENSSSLVGVVKKQVVNVSDTVSYELGQAQKQFAHRDVQVAELVVGLNDTRTLLNAVMEKQKSMEEQIKENSSSLMGMVKSQEGSINETMSSALDEIKIQLTHFGGRTAELVKRLDNTAQTLKGVAEKQERMGKQIEENSSFVRELKTGRLDEMHDESSGRQEELYQGDEGLSLYHGDEGLETSS